METCVDKTNLFSLWVLRGKEEAWGRILQAPFSGAPGCGLSHAPLIATLWTVARQALCPWDFPGKNTGVSCHFLLQGMFPTQGSNLSLLHLLRCWRTLSAEPSQKARWGTQTDWKTCLSWGCPCGSHHPSPLSPHPQVPARASLFCVQYGWIYTYKLILRRWV